MNRSEHNVAFGKKDAIHASIEELLEQLSNAYAYLNVTGSKTRQEQVNMIEGEIKRRISMLDRLVEKCERRAKENDDQADKAKRNDPNDWGGKKLTIAVQNRQIESAWERSKVYKNIVNEIKAIQVSK